MVEFNSQNDEPASGKFQLNTEQIYSLIDRMLPFEACLYHQVLPVAVEGQNLILGMVNLDDTAAIEYVERIAAYLKYTLVPQTLDSEDHRQIVSAYLNRSKNNDLSADKLHFIAAGYPGASPAAKLTTDRPTGFSPNDKPTLILADERENIAARKTSQPQTPQPTPSRLGEIKTPQSQQSAVRHSGLGGIKSAQSQQTAAKPSGLGGIGTPKSQQKSPANPTPSGLSAIKVPASYSTNSVESLKTLPPKELVRELLGRVLEKGIGRL
ncbi:MAG: hypothetical protein ACRCZS_28630, partial [Chroococcidiopsis sp.]